MNLKSICVALAVICIAHEISSSFIPCKCLGEGKDVCNCKQGVKAHRPFPTPAPVRHMLHHHKPLIKTICKEYETSAPSVKPYDPIGDICHCGQTHVKPAPYPIIKPCPCHKVLPALPKWEPKKSTCSCSSCTSNKDSHESQEHHHHHKHHHHQHHSDDCGELRRAPKEFHFEFEGKKKSAPQKTSYGSADVVSVALARQMANSARNSISERQLQYGSKKEPIQNQKAKSERKMIHEDYLHETKGQVLEIKSSLFKKHESSESSSEESDEQPKKRKYEEFNPAKLKYDEIGYGTYHSHNPKYVVIKNTEANHDCSKKDSSRHHHHHHRKHSKPCGCAKDLLVEGSSVSEQSVSYDENASADQQSRQRSYFST